MVKPLNKWPRPAVPAKPAELPSGIFYAVVVHDSSINAVKKVSSRCRNEFDHYVQVNATPVGWEFSDTPTLLTTLSEAQALKDAVFNGYCEAHEETQVFIQVFRLIESAWADTPTGWESRIRDACDMTEGVMSYNSTSEQVKKLAGKVLTILDAAYVNENQNKAVKDLVKSSFRSQLSDMWGIAHADINEDGCEGKSEKDILD